MTVERTIRVLWDAPISWKDALVAANPNDDCGLYQVYGVHVVFGPGSLLYIGKTQRQTFAQRFGQHARWLAQEMDVSVRLGRIHEADYRADPAWVDWAHALDSAERLTIYWHSPPYNSQHIQRYVGVPLRVLHVGDRGRLLPECSSQFDLPARPQDVDS